MPSVPWIGIGQTSIASSGPDLNDVTNLVSRYNTTSVAGTADTKFTSWNDSKGANHLTSVANGGLTYRVAPTGFGGLDAAESAANTDGLYLSSWNGGLAQPISMVWFGAIASGALGVPHNGECVAGYSSFYIYGNSLGISQGPAGNAIFWGNVPNTVAVWSVVWNGATSKVWKNTTQDGADGNLGTGAYAGDFAIGAGSAFLGVARAKINEFAIYSKALTSSDLSNTIVPYFRTKSGLALL